MIRETVLLLYQRIYHYMINCAYVISNNTDRVSRIQQSLIYEKIQKKQTIVNINVKSIKTIIYNLYLI